MFQLPFNDAAFQWVTLPFALSNDHVKPLGSLPPDQWLGTMAPWQVPSYVDSFLMIVFGGVPWQVNSLSTGSYPTKKENRLKFKEVHTGARSTIPVTGSNLRLAV